MFFGMKMFEEFFYLIGNLEFTTVRNMKKVLSGACFVFAVGES